MLFWVTAALLTLGASLAVLLPLSRRAAEASPAAADHDIAVYRDQLKELERDASRGLIATPEAEEARTEIARRILRAASAGDGGDRSAGMPVLPRLIGAMAVLAVPLTSWGLYAYLGSPDLPGQPLHARLTANPAENSIEELIARAEGHLAANPSDGKGWDVLAPIYVRVGRPADAVDAYQNAIRLDGATAVREAGLGEAISAAAGGAIPADARAAFGKALALDPANPKALFYMATALAQDGEIDGAVTAWQAMLPALPADSPWRMAAERALAEAKTRLAEADSDTGPSQSDIDAAAGMTAEDRGAMIDTMVAQLDERLRREPSDPEGWQRLVRSYMVLGRPAQARDALQRGVAALGEGTTAATALVDYSASLGLAFTAQ